MPHPAHAGVRGSAREAPVACRSPPTTQERPHMIRRFRTIVILAAVASLALAGLAQAKTAPVQLSQSTGNPSTVFTLKLTGQKFQNAQDNSEYLEADVVAPAGADQECSVHQGFSYRSTGQGARRKVVFTLDPNELYSQAWCKGA